MWLLQRVESLALAVPAAEAQDAALKLLKALTRRLHLYDVLRHSPAYVEGAASASNGLLALW